MRFPPACCSLRFESFGGMACCIQISDSKALSFLQETAQLLAQPELRSSNSGKPETQPGPRRSSRATHGDCYPSALAAFGPLDALSLISLHCSNLETEPLDRIERPEGRRLAEEEPPDGLSKDYPSNRLWNLACVEEAGAALLKGVGGASSHKPESQRPWRRICRKQAIPRRSCEALDPSFQGVTFQMQLRLCQSTSEGCRLLISPRYSSGKLRKRSRIPLTREENKAGSSEEEEGSLPTHRNKRCASCKTRKTPLWRDAEDGTPLCNACGIRYKKYRIRCFQCWNIPKHGGKPYSHCSSCGGNLRLVAAQQKTGKRC
uniref:Zinc finger GATA like protein 1 n=1 Tax=Salvator merianae TaxID=96440 RepID=A0A8D0DTQ5_SALMN